MIPLDEIFQRRKRVIAACLVAGSLYLCGPYFQRVLQRDGPSKNTNILPSPRSTLLPYLGFDDVAALAYTPDLLPGGRYVETPYGVMRVFEWGPEAGEKVLLLHGVGTPAIALGQLAKKLTDKGYRVMLFDFFGRGYSDGPSDIPFDSRLYISQMLLTLASSQLPWTGPAGFHLIGYSMGGGVAVSFTRYFPHLVRSLTLICGSGLLRSSHVNWKFALLYTRNVLPQWLRACIVKRRLQPQATDASETAEPEAELRPSNSKWGKGDSDASGGVEYDNAVLSTERPDITVASVLAWNLAHHRGFVHAYMQSMRHAPIFNQQHDWRILGAILAERRANAFERSNSHKFDKVLLVMGQSDSILPKDEVVEDTAEALGKDGMELLLLDGGHEIPITKSEEVAASVIAFWERRQLREVNT